MKKTFLIALAICFSLHLYSQGLKDKFNNRQCVCYSIEIGSYIANEGVNMDFNNSTLNTKEKDEIVEKYIKTLESISKKQKDEISSYHLFQDTKDIVFTTIGAFTKEVVPGSSIILDPLYELKAKENAKRAAAFEQEKINEVKIEIKRGIDKIVKQGDSESLRTIINSDSPLLINAETGVAYNEALIKAVNKLGEVERGKMMELINKNKNDIETLLTEQSETIAEVIKLEAWAAASFEEQKIIIAENTRKIDNNAMAIKQNNRLIKQNALRISILETTTVDHDRRISKNTEAIDKINLNLTWDRASLEQKIEGLKSGKFNDLFKNENGDIDQKAIDNLIEDSENLKLRKDISEGARQVSNWGKAASQLFSEIDPKLAEAIDKGVAVSDIVGNYALGNYPQAAMGAMSFVGIGASGSSQESILLKKVLKEISVLKEEMHDRFNKVDKSLELINGNIINVQEYLVAMNKDILRMHIKTQNELNIIKSKLDVLNSKIDCIEDRINALQLSDLNICEVPSKTISITKVKSYQEFLNLIDASRSTKCVQALEDFVNKGQLTKNVFDYVECDLLTEGEISDGDVFIKLLKLWKIQWGHDFNNAYDAMFFPPKYTLENSSGYTFLATTDEEVSFRRYNFLDNNFSDRLKSPLIIERISDYFLKLYPVLEIYKGNGEFRSFEEVLSQNYNISNTPAVKHLDYLLELVDYSIAQQTLMSGHLMTRKFKQIISKGAAEDIIMLESILNNNKILQYNLINNYLAVNYNAALKKSKEVVLKNTKDLLLVIDKSKEDQWIFKLLRKYKLEGEDKEFQLISTMKPLTEINKNPEFLLHPDFYKLLNIRKRIKQKQLELDFIKSLKSSDTKTLNIKEYNNLLISNNNEKI